MRSRLDRFRAASRIQVETGSPVTAANERQNFCKQGGTVEYDVVSHP